MSALLAQVQQPAEGISTGMFSPLIFGTLIYVVLSVLSTVLDNRGDKRADTLGDVAFLVLGLMGVYTLVLVITALASEFDLIVDMVQILAIVIAFFTILVLVLFGLSTLFGVLGRARRGKKRVTT
jgi:predicted transporter